ncbi:hypothetical protein [Spiractinospora alimapuensis]|uniref:hypothetical protein n=1 Tax=Spiractinospora alimapuensis TaxID=2820884 RepID=UPI0037433607
MSGLSTMGFSVDPTVLTDTALDTWALTTAQTMGDACAVCHSHWPRPRTALGVLADGSPIYCCAECAEITQTPVGGQMALA